MIFHVNSYTNFIIIKFANGVIYSLKKYVLDNNKNNNKFRNQAHKMLYFFCRSFTCPACSGYNTESYILPECGHYVCSHCVKRAQSKDNKKEDIMCPVPECGKISKSDPQSKGALGLKEDETYSKLCIIVQGQALVNKKCKGSKTETKPNIDLNTALKRKGTEVSVHEEKYRKYTHTITNSDQRLRNYVKKTSQSVIKWAEDWRAEQEKFIEEAKIEVITEK